MAIVAGSALPQATVRINGGSGPNQANDGSTLKITSQTCSSVSGDGRYVVYQSLARNLTADVDVNSEPDVFLHDRLTGMTTLVSRATTGGTGNGPSLDPDISRDASVIVFRSAARNLIAGGSTGENVFAYHVQTHAIEKVAISDVNNAPAVSPDGRVVVFATAVTYDSADHNTTDVYAKDLQTSTYVWVTSTCSGAPLNGSVGNVSIGFDPSAPPNPGRYLVAFESPATNLVCLPSNGLAAVYVRGIDGSHVTSPSVRITDVAPNTPADSNCRYGRISASGRYVIFQTNATNIAPFPGNPNRVILYDTLSVPSVASYAFENVSVDSSGTLCDGQSGASISGSGRYVSFPSFVRHSPEDTNFTEDVYLRDRQLGTTILVSKSTGNVAGNAVSYNSSVSDNGLVVAFTSQSFNLIAGDTNGFSDIFVRQEPAPPMADAGADQTVEEGALVTLDGSGSTGTPPLVYSWSQIGGTAVTLSNVGDASPTFSAPLVGFGGETLSFRLTVRSGAIVSDPDVVNITVRNLNHAPIADAGSEQTASEGALVALDGTGSFDPDGDTVSYAWQQIGGPVVSLSGATSPVPSFLAPLVGSVGALLQFELTVSDGALDSIAHVDVIVTNVNMVPIAVAGPDASVGEGEAAGLDGSMSSDGDGDPLTYLWSQVAGPAVTLDFANPARPSFLAPLVGSSGAVLEFALVVYDGLDSSAPDTVSILVLDTNGPPSCAMAQGGSLWPPNHGLVLVQITGVIDTDDAAPPTITIDAVYQDEPVTSPEGGDSGPDAVIAGGQLYLRAERAGTGNGRVYHVHFTARDSQGADCTGVAIFTVPHSKKQLPVDGGSLFDSLAL